MTAILCGAAVRRGSKFLFSKNHSNPNSLYCGFAASGGVTVHKVWLFWTAKELLGTKGIFTFLKNTQIVDVKEGSRNPTSSSCRIEVRWCSPDSNSDEELEIQVMESRRRVLGQEHPDKMTSMGNLASTF